MNFILKFLDKATSYANKYAVQREIDLLKNHFENCIKRVDNRADLYFDEIKELNKRIVALEERLKPKPVEPIAMLVPLTTTDAVIKCLREQDGKKLYYKRIYDIIKYYDLINPNVELQSVKATLYQLARQKRIVLDNGTEAGMFFIEKK